jgi:hypothetical protein
MRRLLVLFALLTFSTAGSSHGAGGGATVLALAGGTLDRPSRLVALDRRTLEIIQRGTRLPGWAFGLQYARSPDGRKLAVLPRPSATADRLFVIDTATLSADGELDLGGTACSLAWTRPHVLLAVTSESTCYGLGRLDLVVVDPIARRVEWRASLGAGTVAAAVQLGNRIAVVRGRRLGTTDTVLLAGTAGVESVALGRSPRGGIVAVAADRRLFLVRPDWTVAEVTRGKVSRHRLVLRAPASAAKGETGSFVSAASPGHGKLAIAGGTVARGGPVTVHGAWLVDTHTWKARRLDRTAGWVAAAPGLVLALDGPWDQVSEQSHGSGVAAYDLSGRLRYRALAGKRVTGLRVAPPHAYATRATGAADGFELATGRQTAYDIENGLVWSLLLGRRGP